jgi:hypothetical protein
VNRDELDTLFRVHQAALYRYARYLGSEPATKVEARINGQPAQATRAGNGQWLIRGKVITMKPTLTLLTALLLAPPAALHAADSQPARPIADTSATKPATRPAYVPPTPTFKDVAYG